MDSKTDQVMVEEPTQGELTEDEETESQESSASGSLRSRVKKNDVYLGTLLG